MSEVTTERAGILDHSETNENANELPCSGSEHRTSNEEHIRNTGNETAGGDNNEYDTKKSRDDSEVFSLSLTDTVGVEDKGFDYNANDSTSCSGNVVTVAKVDEENMNDVLSKSSEQNHDVAVSETLTSKKLSVASCDLESSRPTTAEPKTVRAWLKDPLLYKVIPLSSLN